MTAGTDKPEHGIQGIHSNKRFVASEIIMFTSLLVPLPYRSQEMALCTRASFGERCFSNIEAKKQRRGLLRSGNLSKDLSSVISVGRFCFSSSHIVSQLKHLTASMLSRSTVSCVSEHILWISFAQCWI